jgi:hypothetical protein
MASEDKPDSGFAQYATLSAQTMNWQPDPVDKTVCSNTQVYERIAYGYRISHESESSNTAEVPPAEDAPPRDDMAGARLCAILNAIVRRIVFPFGNGIGDVPLTGVKVPLGISSPEMRFYGAKDIKVFIEERVALEGWKCVVRIDHSRDAVDYYLVPYGRGTRFINAIDCALPVSHPHYYEPHRA